MTAKAPPLSWIRGTPAERLAWRRYWVRDVISGVNTAVLHYALKLGTIGSCSGLGGAMAVALGPLYRPHADRIRANLLRLRPDVEPVLPAVMTRVWDNIGRTLAEFSVIERLWDSPRVAVEGLEHIEAARATGRPRIYVGLHLGNWELLGPKLIDLGEKGFDFYEPPPNRFRRAITERARRRFDKQLLPPGPTAALRAVRLLKEQDAALVIFVDEVRARRVKAPSFGRGVDLDGNLANAVRLALMTNALVLPANVLREPGARFRLRVEAPIELTRAGDRETNVRVNAERLDALMTPIVLRHIDQWMGLPQLRFEV